MNPRISTVIRSAWAAFALCLAALALTGCVPEFIEQGGLCEEGDRRLADDGCNTCVCEAGGWACTEMACVPDCLCPAVYAPVCGADGLTYGNACEAECAEAEVVAEGECAGACPDPADPNVSYVSDDPAECALIDFVCGGDARGFSDACGCGCIANDPSVCGEGEVMHQNECKTLCGDPEQGDVCPEGTACGGCAPDPGCPECDVCLLVCEPAPAPPPVCDACPEIWAPVCGLDGVTYGNACEADCAGADVAYEGECRVGCEDEPQGDGPGDTPCEPEPEPEPCACDLDWAPVCGLDGQSYFNACDAACHDTGVAYEGECYQWCLDPEGAPPPADGDHGESDEGRGEEGAGAEGAGAEGEPQADAPGDVLCDPPQPACVCPEIYAPVCGVDGRTFANECAAACAHVEVDYEGECPAPCGGFDDEVDCG